MRASRGRVMVRVAAALAAAGFAVVMVQGVANAGPYTDYWTNVSVSCNSGTYTDVDNFTSIYTATVTVHQTSTSPTVTGGYHLQSSLGNNTSAKAASDGQSVSWSSVLVSTYKVWHTANTSVNCNGILPGNGNTQLTGWVNFD